MDFIKRMYFDVVSYIISMIAKGTGWIHGPWTHKKTSQDDVEAIKDKLRIGDIILTHTRGEFSTLTIPGWWKHCEINLGDRKTVGAVNPKVRMAWLEDVIHDTDYFCIVRLNDMTDGEGCLIAEHAYNSIGKNYDMRMNFNKPNEVSCSELVYNAVNRARPDALELRNRLGFDTFTPQDFYDAKSKFTVIYES